MEQVTRTRRLSAGGWSISVRRRLFTATLLTGIALNGGRHCKAASADETIEYQVKAAFLLNFTRFVQWPPTAFADADSPMAICILGEDPFGNIIDQIVAGEVVAGRKVVVRRIGSLPAPQACQVLYVRKRENGNAEGARAGRQPNGNTPIAGPGVLTVGEGSAFAREGGMVAFILETRRVRFDINQTAAESAGLKLSARLLSVARTVEK